MRLFSLLFLMLFTGLGARAQEMVRKPARNLLEFYMPFYEFLDGTPIIYGKTFERDKFPGRYGLSYSRHIDIKTRVQVSAEYYSLYYFKEFGTKTPGEVNERQNFLYTASFLYSPFENNLFFITGLRYRRGWEGYHWYYYSTWEQRSLNNINRDLGSLFGIKFIGRIWQNFYAGAEFGYTYYFYIKDMADVNLDDPGSSRQLLSTNLKIGYSFGKNNRKS